MTPNECDVVINWCRRKIDEKWEQHLRHYCKEAEFDGYKDAMLAVMSYFHYIKEEVENANQT